MEHKSKILPQYFKSVKEGSKPFEIRKNDRDYKVGDTLILQEWAEFDNPIGEYAKGFYTTREINKEITYILEGGQYGLEEGYPKHLKKLESRPREKKCSKCTSYS